MAQDRFAIDQYVAHAATVAMGRLERGVILNQLWIKDDDVGVEAGQQRAAPFQS
jgi:hypothetical protein